MNTTPRRGLGRGLGSLIPTSPSTPSPPAQGPEAVDGVTNGSSSAGSTSNNGVSAAVEVVAGTVAGAYFAELPITQVRPNARQPRQVFEEEALAELVHSIREVGLLQPVVVRKSGEDSYELIMG